MNNITTGKLSVPWKIILLLLPVTAAVICLGTGRIFISPAQVIKTLFQGHTTEQMSKVIWNIRLPRILLSMLVGAGLSVAGCSFQSLFANPLATPDTLGVASGASFGAALGLLLGFNLIGVQLTALGFGVIAISLSYISAAGKTSKINSVVLAGIMMGSLFNALISLVKFTADTETQLPTITYWLMGSFSSAGYKTLSLGAPIILTGMLILFLIRWKMNILPLSEDEAASLGTNIRLLRIITAVCATAITASCVSMCGQVGWIGLLVPHICRMKFGNSHLALIPASISIGAAFMTIVDTIARSASAAEIPVSVLTAIIGAPFFIILMRKSGGWEL